MTVYGNWREQLVCPLVETQQHYRKLAHLVPHERGRYVCVCVCVYSVECSFHLCIFQVLRQYEYVNTRELISFHRCRLSSSP